MALRGVTARPGARLPLRPEQPRRLALPPLPRRTMRAHDEAPDEEVITAASSGKASSWLVLLVGGISGSVSILRVRHPRGARQTESRRSRLVASGQVSRPALT